MMLPLPLSAAFAAFIQSEAAKWAGVIRAGNISLQ